jgi:hypothetical protein
MLTRNEKFFILRPRYKNTTYFLLCDMLREAIGHPFRIKALFVCLVAFNTTFNNIPAVSWRSVLLVEETGGHGENHRPASYEKEID